MTLEELVDFFDKRIYQLEVKKQIYWRKGALGLYELCDKEMKETQLTRDMLLKTQVFDYDKLLSEVLSRLPRLSFRFSDSKMREKIRVAILQSIGLCYVEVKKVF